MLPRENYLFGCARSEPSQISVPAGLTLASDFGFCFQRQAGSSLVLRRPIEITRIIGNLCTMANSTGNRYELNRSMQHPLIR